MLELQRMGFPHHSYVSSLVWKAWVEALRVVPALSIALAAMLVRPAFGTESASSTDDVGVSLNAVGPPLDRLRTKVADPNWLVAYLVKPSRLQPGTIMPDSDLTPDEARALARYLYGGDVPTASGDRWQGGDARKGEDLFTGRGCRGCHATRRAEKSVSPRVPNLAGIGLEVRGDWLFEWLGSPRSYDPHTSMPELPLSEEENRHLVAFLLSRKEGAEVVAAGPGFDPSADPAEGRRVFELYECATCHRADGFPPPEPAFELADGDSPKVALRNGRLLVDFYNCRGCHVIEGRGGAIAEHLERKTLAPPLLDGEGARVQSSWLVNFLQHPARLRPWLSMEMPDYGLSEARARAFSAYFAALAEVPAADEPPPDPSARVTARGLGRVALYKCGQCHPADAEAKLPDGADPDDVSINLMLAKTRLRPSWVRGFLAHPKEMVGAQTRMPSIFYTPQGRPKVDQPDRDINDIVTYLFHMSEPLHVSLARMAAERKAEQDTEEIDWSTVEY